jgi:hypothetical protein
LRKVQSPNDLRAGQSPARFLLVAQHVRAGASNATTRAMLESNGPALMRVDIDPNQSDQPNLLFGQ